MNEPTPPELLNRNALDPPPATEQGPPGPPLFWDIVEASLDEAEFLWERRRRLVDSHQHDLDRIALWAEDRLLGALEGAGLPGARGVDSLLTPAVASGTPARIACAVHIAAGLDDPGARALIERALESFVGADLAAVGEALALAESIDPAALRRLLARVSAPQQATLLDVLAAHATDPGGVINDLARSEDARVRGAAIACAVAARSPSAAALVTQGLGDTSLAVVAASARAGIAAGHRDAWEACRSSLSARPAPEWGALLPLIAASGTDAALTSVLACLGVPELRRDALFALGFCGTRAAAEQALSLMAGGRSALAHVAAESFATITGLDLTRPELWVSESSEAPSFDADDLDEDLTLPTDAELPLLELDAVRAWWGRHADGFEPGVRYLRGERTSSDALIDFLHTGPGRRRHGVAAELAVRSGGALRIATRAWTSRQRRELAQARGLDARQLSRPPLPGWYSLP